MEETIKLLDKTLDQHYVRWSFKIVEVAVDAVQNADFKLYLPGKQSERVNVKAVRRIMMRGWRSSLRTRTMKTCTFSQRWICNNFNCAQQCKICLGWGRDACSVLSVQGSLASTV